MGKYESKKKVPKGIFVIFPLLLVACLVIFVMPRALHTMPSNPDAEEFPESSASQIQETETQSLIEDENTTHGETQDTAGETQDTVGETQDTVELPSDPDAEDLPENNTSQIQETETKPPVKDKNTAHETQGAVEFPSELDGGNIRIESLFQFTGVNPDAQKQKATDVSAIELTNASSKYLREATVTVTLATGKKVSFMVTDVPAGADVMAFSVDNAPLLATDVCTAITANTVFGDETNYDGVEVSVDGMMITVKNTSSKDVELLDVYYRDVFGDKYFGGKTNICNIEYLSAGESVTVAAEETLLGVIEVVRVAANHKN